MTRSGPFDSNRKRRLFFQAKKDSPVKRYSKAKMEGVCSKKPDLTPLLPSKAFQRWGKGKRTEMSVDHVHMVDGVLQSCDGKVE